MSEKKLAVASRSISEQQPAVPNRLDIVPEKIPFDVPYGPPISLERAQGAINAVVAGLYSDRRAQGSRGRNLPPRNQFFENGTPGQQCELLDDIGWSGCFTRRYSSDR